MTTTIHEFISTLDPTITGAEIRTAREDLGLSLDEVACFLDVQAIALAEWEADISKCPMPLGVRYSLAYLSLSNQINGDPAFDDLDQKIAEAEEIREQIRRDRTELRAKLAQYDTTPT